MPPGMTVTDLPTIGLAALKRWSRVGWCLVGASIIVLGGLMNVSATSDESAATSQRGESIDGETYDGLIIDSIVIEPRNIYNSAEPRYDHWVFRMANRLHMVTRAKVIRRELLFAVGEPYVSELAEELGRNLRTRYALNDAWVEVERLPSGHLLVRVITVDKWSLVGGFRLAREGNRTNYQFGLEERNLFGWHKFLSFDYYVQEQKDNYLVTKYSDRRYLGRPLTLDLQYSNNPDDKYAVSQMSHPFYNLGQRWSYLFGYARTGGRRSLPFDSITAASVQTTGDIVESNLTYRWGPYRSKFSLGADYRYRYWRTFDRIIYVPAYQDSVVYPSDSLYHRFGIEAQYDYYDFVKAHRIIGMKYTEDLTLGFAATLNFGRAFTAHFDDFVYDDIGIRLSYSDQFGGSIVMADYTRSMALRENTVLRRGNRVTVSYYNTSLTFLTIAARSVYVSETRADGGNTLVLGGLNGLRGFDEYFNTGDRYHVLNMECRFYPNIELLSVIIGGAAFADLGRAWKRGEHLAFKNYSSAVGIGLRISLEKLSKGELIRVDLANGQNHVWQWSVGSRQYF
jgi:hypothetical protein